ncbi:MAG TPA: flagellar basal body L-ring protein FlgH [Dongiaceae bacterium]|nr:flagellar basal body L-ring protein FlgH [Dongiaceae bacterium]
MKFKPSILLSFSLLLAGCATAPNPAPGDPRYSPVAPVAPAPATAAVGSIYASGAGISLWEDKRARRIGDIITVMLEEKTISSKSNKTDIKKEDTLDMEVNSLMGVEPSFHLPGMDNRYTLSSDTENKRDFKGDAGSDQSNRLQGEISVTVADVLSNGTLVVRGEKWMTLSQGDEFIRLEGLLRPSDIAPDNTVLSSRMADARITYSATGALANAQQQGFVSKVFNSPWWPF